MIEMSPKALRFARLAAENLGFDGDPSVTDIRDEEHRYRTAVRDQRGVVSRYISISDETARFCLTAIESILARPEARSADWDENDLRLLASTESHIRQELAARDELGPRSSSPAF